MVAATWTLAHTNNFAGPALIFQTVYEQRYLRAAINGVLDRLPSRRAGVEFGAGYGRMTVILEEFFERPLGLERERAFLTANSEVRSEVEMIGTPSLSAVPLADGAVDFAFTCAVLQHMLDEEVRDTLAEMRRVVTRGFILLIESASSFLIGEYSQGSIFTKGRPVIEYRTMMGSWVLDFVRPRHIGSTNGPIWGSLMMFRSPDIAPGARSGSESWRSDEVPVSLGGGIDTPSQRGPGVHREFAR